MFFYLPTQDQINQPKGKNELWAPTQSPTYDSQPIFPRAPDANQYSSAGILLYPPVVKWSTKKHVSMIEY